MLQELKLYAQANKVPIILDDSLDFICQLIVKHQYRSMLEIGSAIGYSALSFALKIPTLQVTTIEKKQELYMLAQANLHKYDKGKQVTLLLGDALEVNLKQSFDVIFIDAAKAKNQAFFERFAPLLNKDGLIITDNIDFHQLTSNDLHLSKNVRKMLLKLEQYKEYLKSLPDFETTFWHLGDGLAVSKRRV